MDFVYVFLNPKTGTRYISINRTFDRAVRKLGLTVNGTKLRFHDLRHIFGTWLHQAGVSLDVIRPLLGHKDRETTDRYITYDRLSYNDVLKVIPRIERSIKKEIPDNQNPRSPLEKNGKNWQGQGRDHMLFLPKTAVSP